MNILSEHFHEPAVKAMFLAFTEDVKISYCNLNLLLICLSDLHLKYAHHSYSSSCKTYISK